MNVSVNVVVLAGTIAADPVVRRVQLGENVVELRLSVPEDGKRLLPLPVAIWGDVPIPPDLAKGDAIVVHGKVQRRFYRSGAGARSLTEIVASSVQRLEEGETP